MGNDVSKLNVNTELTEAIEQSVSPEYKVMLQDIKKTMPAMMRDSGNFYKSHSQYMYTMLDVTQVTPIRSIKHILAEINRTKGALEEAYYNMRKDQLELKKLERSREQLDDEFEIEENEIEQMHIKIKIKNTQDSVQGAVRKFRYFTEQYKSVLSSIGKTEEEGITEEEYEREEEKYHIMTAMSQALTAARSSGGHLDEGNNIYIQQMGVNGATAQTMIFEYLKQEEEMFKQGKEPSHEMIMNFLESCYEKFKGSSQKYAEKRGFKLFDNKSIHIGFKEKE